MKSKAQVAAQKRNWNKFLLESAYGSLNGINRDYLTEDEIVQINFIKRELHKVRLGWSNQSHMNKE